MAHYFRLKCLDTDSILQKRFANTNKRKCEEIEQDPLSKRICGENEIVPPDSPGVNVNGNEDKKTDSSQNSENLEFKTKVVTEPNNFQKVFIESVTVHAPPTVKQCDFDEIEKDMKRIHGTDDVESTVTVVGISDQLGIKEIVITKKQTTPLVKPKFIKTVSINPETPKIKIKAPAEPKEEKPFSYVSKTGTFPCEIRMSVYNNSFCVADGYLFEFGLVKQGNR